MDIEKLLATPLVETFVTAGLSPTIDDALDAAWLCLQNAHRTGTLDTAWSLKVMQHVWSAQGVQYQAEFVRMPDE